MDIFKVILTALLSVAALFIITKIMGHKQVAQLDFFDYVSGITIGSIGAELATELERPENPLIALAVYGLASLLLNLLAHKMPKTRKYINGTPTILMNDGKLSILPKAANRPVTPEDLKISVTATHIGVELIMDGRVMGEKLSRIGRNGNWLAKQLKTQGYKDESSVFLGIYRPEEDTLTLYPNE